MQKIELESISDKTKGLPDCWHVDANGKSSPEVFQKHFKLPRSLRNEKKLVEHLFNRPTRLGRFVVALVHYRHLGTPFMLTGDEFASPEAHAMARFDEGWHLRNEEDLMEFARLDRERQRLMLADLLAQRDQKEFKNHQIKLQALANRASLTVERAYEIMVKCAIESWLRARNELANWARLDESERSLLAEVIFCGFTFFGKHALEEAAAIELDVLSHYRQFRGLPSVATTPIPVVPMTEQKSAEAPVAIACFDGLEPSVLAHAATPQDEAQLADQQKDVDAAPIQALQGHESLTAPQSLKQLYELIGNISIGAQSSDDVGPEPALRIKDLLERHLQRLTDLNERISPKEVSKLIEHYCHAVLNMTVALDFENSEQRDLVPVLRSAWRATVISALETGLPRTWFDMTLVERRHLPEFVERFDAEQGKIAAAAAEIEGIKAQLVEAKYTAKTALKARETKKQNEISDANRELETIRVEAAHCLAPDGKTLDDLMEDQSALEQLDLDVDGFDSGTLKSLKMVVEGLAASSASDDVADPASLPVLGTSEPVVAEAVVECPATPPAAEQEAGIQVGPVGAESSVAASDIAPTLDADEAGAMTNEAARHESAPSEKSEAIAHASVDSADQSATAPTVAGTEGDVPVDEDLNVPDQGGEDRLDSKMLGVEGALRHLHYAESKDEALQAFRIAYDQFSQVPSGLAESIAMHWLEAGHLNVAYQILRDANDSTLFTDRVLDASLLRSAFYGMNLWPKDREALSHTQRDLNLLNYKDLEEQLDRKPSGKLVPYLLVCATLQPALFAGGETQAPTLLKVAVDYFDGPLKQLVSNTAEFAMRGGRVDLDALRNDQAQEVNLAAAKLQDQVNAWVDINAQRTTRWHSLRVALKLCCDEQIIGPAIAAVRAGESGDSAAVRTFVNTYRSHIESRSLLDELVARIRADSPQVDQLDSSAYLSFCQQIDSLVAIAQSWLLEVIPADVRPKETKEFLQKFHTQLDRSITSFLAPPRHADLEHRAGSALLLKALTRLQTEIKADSHSTWRFDQTDATFRVPETLARMDLGDVGVDLRLEWLATRLLLPNWLGQMIELAVQHKAYWVQLLLLRQLREMGDQRDSDIDAANAAIAGTRAEIKQSIEQFRNLSIQAMWVDLITEDDHLFNMAVLNEWLDKLSNLKPFVDVSSIWDEVKNRTRGLENLLNSSASELDDELNQALLNIRTKVGADAVPEGWDARARSALERRNLTVVRELINQLQDHINRSARLQETSQQENVDLRKFLEVEPALFNLLHTHPNPREAGERVIHEQPGGLDYSVRKAAFKDTIGTLMEWRGKGPHKRPTLDRATYEGIVKVLRFAGFTEQYATGAPDVLANCEYSPSGGFRRLKVRVARPALPKGFPLFEGDLSASIPLNIIFVQGDWSLAGLSELVERHGLPDRALLMVGEPLSRDERKGFASFCRDRKCTIFLLDPVVLSYLAVAPDQQATLETFLRVTAAWTFYNPYTKGDARLPAPPEMRFGRENDIASLVEPRGAALVYGGRQLGKTTLLNSAVQVFQKRDPSRNHAFYLRMVGQFQHAVERDGMDVKTRVLELLVNKLTDAKLLPPNSQATPEERLNAEFQRDGSTRVLFCLDEIDSILNKDARTNFQLVSSLVALVNDPHQRFRVVFAGLNNVNRFRTYPNVPLEQLGRPLEVKILPAQDARSLILQPLTSLGYCFEEVELVDRIMAFTNRHPSLLHIFCSELVEQLGRERSADGGLRVIRQADLESIENNSDVRRLSGLRFDMTLNLDKRYAVAVYGLIDRYGKGIGNITVKQALDVARSLVPEEFEQMSESGFEGLLEELVGLGVLRVVDQKNRQYALRNQSILQLIGGPNEISHNLQVAVRELYNYAEDALTCHPSGSNLAPSPLTLQDEKQVLSAMSPDGSPRYSVSVIMGTPALGLSIKTMEDSFSAINEFQVGNTLSRYGTQAVQNAEAIEPKRFAEILDKGIDTWALSQPAVILVSLEERSSINKIMDLISIANERASRASRLKHRLRIVFLLGARAMWGWHSHPWLTAAPNEIGGLVELNRWTRHACEGLLDQQDLGVTAEQADQLYKATEGWYDPLMKFIEVRQRKRGATSFNDFSKDFTALCHLPAKDFAKFVQKTGMTSLAWSMPLASQLHVFDALNEFSDEDLQAAIEFLGNDFQSQISPEQAANVVRWWTALRVIEANTKETSAKAGKGGKVTYRFTPTLQRAIIEYTSQAATVTPGRQA